MSQFLQSTAVKYHYTYMVHFSRGTIKTMHPFHIGCVLKTGTLLAPYAAFTLLQYLKAVLTLVAIAAVPAALQKGPTSTEHHLYDLNMYKKDSLAPK